MNLVNINLSAPIIPGKSMGGINLGASWKDIDTSEFVIKFESDFETVFCYRQCLEVYVTKSNNLIYKIAGLRGYNGTFNSLMIGCHFSQLLEDRLNLKLDFLNSEFEFDQVDGLRFGPSDTGFKFDDIPSLIVAYFTIFPLGMEGYDEEDFRKVSKSDFS